MANAYINIPFTVGVMRKTIERQQKPATVPVNLVTNALMRKDSRETLVMN